VSDRLNTSDFAWKRVVVCGPHHVDPLDEGLVGATMMRVLLAKPACVIVGDSGTDLLALGAVLRMIQMRHVHPLLDVTAVVTYCLGQVPDLTKLLDAAHLPSDGSRHVKILQLEMDPGRGESYLTRDMVKLGRSGWDCMSSVVLAFTPAGGWRNAKIMPPLLARAREQGMTVIEVALPNTNGKPPSRC